MWNICDCFFHCTAWVIIRALLVRRYYNCVYGQFPPHFTLVINHLKHQFDQSPSTIPLNILLRIQPIRLDWSPSLLGSFTVLRVTRASRLRDVDLDAFPENSTSVISTKQEERLHYIFEDILDCLVGSRFIVCIAAGDNGDDQVVIIPRQRLLLQVIWSRRDCLWNRGGCPAKNTWWFRARLIDHPTMTKSRWKVSVNVIFAILSQTRVVTLQYGSTRFQPGWPFCGVILLMQAEALCSLVCRSRKVGHSLHSFGKWNLSMHITSSVSLHQSILAIHGRVWCYTLSISKQGWMPRLQIWCHRTPPHVLWRIFSMSRCSTARRYAGFSSGLTAIVNMHLSTAWIITMTTASR